MTDYDCYCSTDEGPCEEHMTVEVIREGSSLRTADELLSVFVWDATSLGVELSPWGKSTLTRYDEALADNERHGVAWLPDGMEGLHDDMMGLVYQVETALATGDRSLEVRWDDGYVIYEVTGGPLEEDQ